MTGNKKGIVGLFEEIKTEGIPFDNWCSDLYIPVNDQTTEILKRRGLYGTVSASVFTSQLKEDKGSQWYDIAFAYSPYWEKKTR